MTVPVGHRAAMRQAVHGTRDEAAAAEETDDEGREAFGEGATGREIGRDGRRRSARGAPQHALQQRR